MAIPLAIPFLWGGGGGGGGWGGRGVSEEVETLGEASSASFKLSTTKKQSKNSQKLTYIYYMQFSYSRVSGSAPELVSYSAVCKDTII